MSRREHSRDELRRKLAAAGFPADLVDEVLADLAQRGLQSDARFAEAYVRDKTGRGYGSLRIRHDLQRLGVAAELGDCDWDDLIEQAYARKYRDSLPQSPRDLAARQRFLLQRGFGHEEIRRLFKRLRQHPSSPDPSILNDSSL